MRWSIVLACEFLTSDRTAHFDSEPCSEAGLQVKLPAFSRSPVLSLVVRELPLGSVVASSKVLEAVKPGKQALATHGAGARPT